MIARYGPGGALVSDERPPGLDDLRPLDEGCARFYGGRYLIAESMSLGTAEAIARALGMTLVPNPTKED